MTKAQKATLRDLFEGYVPFMQATFMAGITATEYPDAFRTWARWAREMDERGYYTF